MSILGLDSLRLPKVSPHHMICPGEMLGSAEVDCPVGQVKQQECQGEEKPEN